MRTYTLCDVRLPFGTYDVRTCHVYIYLVPCTRCIYYTTSSWLIYFLIYLCTPSPKRVGIYISQHLVPGFLYLLLFTTSNWYQGTRYQVYITLRVPLVVGTRYSKYYIILGRRTSRRSEVWRGMMKLEN